jgi:hypothetical protein
MAADDTPTTDGRQDFSVVGVLSSCRHFWQGNCSKLYKWLKKNHKELEILAGAEQQQ